MPPPMTDVSLAEVASVVRAAADGDRPLVLACHHHPDGDALGSMLAMHLLCRANGIDSVATWPSPWVVGPHYEFLPGLESCTPPGEVPADPALLITFDLGSVERLGDLGPLVGQADAIVVLDHHADNQRFGTHNHVDTTAAATAVVVRQLAEALGWPLTRDAALCLYVGLVTDTGRFQLPNTTPDVFHLAEELANYDLPIAEITRTLFDKHRFQYVQLVAMVLARAKLDLDRRFVVAWLTADDLARYDVAFDETEGLIDHLRACADADVAAVLKEAPGEGLRVSLRSTGPVDVQAVARQFGGGGHKFMAGFTTHAPVADTIAAVRALVPVREAPPPPHR